MLIVFLIISLVLAYFHAQAWLRPLTELHPALKIFAVSFDYYSFSNTQIKLFLSFSSIAIIYQYKCKKCLFQISIYNLNCPFNKTRPENNIQVHSEINTQKKIFTLFPQPGYSSKRYCQQYYVVLSLFPLSLKRVELAVFPKQTITQQPTAIIFTF